MKRPKNPFLPKVRLPPRRKQSIAWRTGPAAGTVGIPALEDNDQAIVPGSLATRLTDIMSPISRKQSLISFSVLSAMTMIGVNSVRPPSLSRLFSITGTISSGAMTGSPVLRRQSIAL
jgi:hypothetical protein